MTTETTITDDDRNKAEFCKKCPVCSRARAKQKGIAYWFVKTVEDGRCPYCTAYHKVYGRKAFEPLPAS